MAVKLCECGCGEPAPIATKTNNRWGHVQGQPVRFIRGHVFKTPKARADASKRGKEATGSANPFWKGGRMLHKRGYIVIHNPTFPHGMMCEHRIVAQQKLGRPLTSQDIICHKDSNRSNNSPDNLQVFSNRADHARYHARQRKRQLDDKTRR